MTPPHTVRVVAVVQNRRERELVSLVIPINGSLEAGAASASLASSRGNKSIFLPVLFVVSGRRAGRLTVCRSFAVFRLTG